MTNRIWTEDECTLHDESAERIGAAWLRLFGAPKPNKDQAVRHRDYGDGMEWEYPGGLIEGFDCDSHYIIVSNVVDLREWKRRRDLVRRMKEIVARDERW